MLSSSKIKRNPENAEPTSSLSVMKKETVRTKGGEQDSAIIIMVNEKLMVN